MVTGAEVVVGTSPGTALMDILMADELQPGDAPSYQLCKDIYLYHPFGAKMTDSPVRRAIAKAREITVPPAPDMVVEEFKRQWKADHQDDNVFQLGSTARIYGVASLAMGVKGEDPDKPLNLDKLWDRPIWFNCLDPLNTGGTIVLNQDPNSDLFQKHTVIGVSGQPYHRSRTVVLMNERPVYIAWTSSAFGFVGRSVYQRPLYPLKTFIQTMITDQAVTEKAALLIAKIHQAGSIGDRLMEGFNRIKRSLLKGARTGNVLNINAGSHNGMNDEGIETLNMQNVDKAASMARTNVIKNIATAADMPAIFLENETLTEGFGEGTEDAKQIADYLDQVRTWLQPVYDFLDDITMRRAWNPEFYKLVQAEYPDFADIPYAKAFYQWKNSFQAVWPSLLQEPESEAVETDKVKAETIVSILEIFLKRCDPENAAQVLKWAADNLNQNKVMFATPLVLDWEALANFDPVAAGLEGDDDMPEPKPKGVKADSVVKLLGGDPQRRRTGR